MANPPPRLARARRAIFRVASAVGYAATLAVSGSSALVLHADLPAARRLLARTLTHTLSDALEGEITVETIDAISLEGLDGGRATVRDPEGRTVLVADGIRVRASLPELAYAALFESGDSTLVLRRVRIERAEVTLLSNESGEVSLARAFTPKAAPAAAPASQAAKDRAISLWLPAVRVRHATVRGELPGAAIPLDLELANLKGSVLAGPEHTSIRADRFGLLARGLDIGKLSGEAATNAAELRGTAEAQVELPSASGAPFGAWASFDGFLDDVQASLRGSVDGERVELSFDLPRAEPEALKAVFPALPVYETVALHAKIEGAWPRLEAMARVRLGEGEAVARGPVLLGEAKTAELALELRGFDARGIDPRAPATRIDGKGQLSLRFPRETGISGSFDFRTEPATIDAFSLPPISMRGEIEGSRVETRATVHAPGMPIDVKKLVVRPDAKGEGVTVELEASGDIPALQKVPELAGIATGRAHWYARGTLSGGKVDSHVGVLLNDVRRDEWALEQAAIVGRVTGALAKPSIDVSLVGRNVTAGGIGFRNIRGTALGPLTSPRIVASLEHDTLPLLTARGTVRMAGSGASIDKLEIEASRRNLVATLRAPKASFGKEGVALPSFTLEGLGEPAEGALRIGPQGVSLQAKGAVDLGLVSALLDARRVAEDAVVRTRNAVLRDVFPILWSNYVEGMRASFDVEVAQHRSGDSGRLSFAIEHASRTALPELRVGADLRVLGKELQGTGVTIALGDLASITVLPEAATIAGSLFDAASWERATGKLAVRSSVDFDELNKLARMLPDGMVPFEKLGGTLSTRLSLRRDDGGRLPDLELSTTTKGLELVALPPVSSEEATQNPQAWASKGLDFSMSGSVGWQEERARLRAVLANDGREIVEVSVEAEPPFEKLVAQPRRASALLRQMPLAVHVRVPRTQLATLPSFLRPGWFDGDIELSGDMHGSWDMPIVTLEAGGYGLVSRDRGDVPLVLGAYATYGFSETDVQLRVTEPSGGDLTASATVQAKLDDLLSPPALAEDPSAGFVDRLRHLLLERTTADARLRATAFRLAPFQPLVDHVFTQLDGRVDGSFRVHQEPGKDGVRRTLDGVADVTSGVFQLPEIGQELHDATAHIVADGQSTIHVQDISASGITGRLSGDVTVTHRNLAFDGLTASFAIAERERLPLTLEGVSFGDAWGRIHVNMREGKDDGGIPATIVDVNIPELVVELPESSTRNVQSLTDNPRVRIGRRTFDGELIPIALGPPKDTGEASRWLVNFRLGDRVTVKRGTLLQLGLTGAPRMAVTDRAYVSGDVWLTGGYVEVFGKRFDIAYGSARFHPATDAGNPWVAVSARWDAPDATRIYADYVGPIKTGTLTLRSEPARTPSEILALVLFGTSESDAGAGYQSEPGSQAAGVGTSLATAGLNRVLSGVTGATITTRVDTSVSQNPRPEVAIRLSDSVTAQVAYSTGLPAPGQNPDRVLVTLGWNFRQRWSLSTTVGDKGSSVVDVIWQYRY